jgi:hypothetical protein
MNTLVRIYSTVGMIVAIFIAMLVAVVRITPSTVDAHQNPGVLIMPMVALAGLTALVAVLMVVYRNLAFIRGLASERYFQAYASDTPAEWIERPARTYMNLLELPVLFYVACLGMLITGNLDNVQVILAWIFVTIRYVHAFIHIGFNYVSIRFAAYFAGFITLVTIWTRFAAQNM